MFWRREKLSFEVEKLSELPLSLRQEVAENVHRKDLTETELAAVQSRLKKELGKYSEQGKRTDLEEREEIDDIGTSPKVFEEVDKGSTEIIGNMFGESHRNVEKRTSVYEAAEENPKKFGDLTERLDGGSVNSAYREYKRRKETEERKEELEDAPELKNLYLGDCTEKIENIPDESVDAVVTDPPYGIDEITGARSETENIRKDWHYEGDDEAIFPLLEKLFQKLRPKLKKDSHLYFFTSWKVWHKMYPLANEFFNVKNWIVYLHYLSTAGDLYQYRTAASSIMFATNGGKRYLKEHKWNFFDEKGNYRQNGKSYHPAQKSVSICKKLIENSTVEGETVLDPFCGSGTTLVAAEKLDRNWIGIELEERWQDIARQRIAEAREDGGE